MGGESGQIFSFKHCVNHNRIFCLKIPHKCPICDEQILLKSSPLQHEAQQINEVRIMPSPLKCVSKSQCSLAIRPIEGNFLTDYKNSSDLHICVTTSDGRVVEYDQNGARISENSDRWKSCLVIKVFDNLSQNICQLWDIKLEQFVTLQRWTQSAYDSLSNNCFDFVLEFLRALNIEHLNSSVENKTKFCEHFIVPKTKLLARYISLYRKIQSDKVVVLELTPLTTIDKK